jgi:hypothetical protein
MRGDQCAFVNELDPVIAAAEQEIATQVEESETWSAPVEEEVDPDFPALVVQKPTATQTWNARNVVELPITARMKLDSLAKEFSNLHSGLVLDEFNENGWNAQKTRKSLLDKFGKSGSSTGPIVPVIDLRDKNPTPAPSKPKQKTSLLEEEGEVLPWLSTGEKMSSLYLESRKEAEEHAKMRNHFFMLATEAFMRGDGKRAKALSQEGRYHDAKAKELHDKAAQKIFEQRNKRLHELADGRTIVDVHGLHPDEAVDAISKRLKQLKTDHPESKQDDRKSKKKHKKKKGAITEAKSKDVYLDVITGTGHHSYTGESKLLPAIRDFLFIEGYDYQELKAGGMGGVVRIRI